MNRPARLVVVTGTGTEVGKTWWATALARDLRAARRRVAARKPVQSFDPAETATDAALLAAATGETEDAVCPPHRRLAVPMAPPMAAMTLGRPPFTIADLAAETIWPEPTDVGLVEGAGGVRSPLTLDGDTIDLVRALDADTVLLVAIAGLGAINAVRLCVDALAGWPVVVALNHFDHHDDVHRANLDWLAEHDGYDVVTDPATIAARWA